MWGGRLSCLVSSRSYEKIVYRQQHYHVRVSHSGLCVGAHNNDDDDDEEVEMRATEEGTKNAHSTNVYHILCG